MQRVRLASVPHTDYIRWGLDVSPLNIEAGEDIRYLPRHLADGIKLPEEDYWLLDDDTLILSVFSADGRTGGFAREPSRNCSGSAWSSATRCGTGLFPTTSTSPEALGDQP